MIRTRFGSEVKILAGNMETGEIIIEYDDGKTKDTYLYELRADGGIAEIEKAIDKIK